MKKRFLWLFLSRLLIGRVAGGKAAFFRENWYRQAQVSPLTPPNWVFGVAWPVNYATSAWAAAIFASRTGGAERNRWISLWFLQAVSTSIWTRIFGDLKRPDWALKSFILAWVLAILTSKKFASTSPAGLWMIPLCLWLTLAIELNTEFVVRNPPHLKSPNPKRRTLTFKR
jgi:tryptophan-rich sensory protein